jgi:hypothetical protein
MNKENSLNQIIVFPDVRFNCGWVEEIKDITNDNIRLISPGTHCILLSSEHEGWIGYAVLNFSAN